MFKSPLLHLRMSVQRCVAPDGRPWVNVGKPCDPSARIEEWNQSNQRDDAHVGLGL